MIRTLLHLKTLHLYWSHNRIPMVRKPDEISKNRHYPHEGHPLNENLLKVDKNSPELSKDKAELFHTFVAKTIFITKRARPDVAPNCFPQTRVKTGRFAHCGSYSPVRKGIPFENIGT